MLSEFRGSFHSNLPIVFYAAYGHLVGESSTVDQNESSTIHLSSKVLLTVYLQ